MKTTDIKAYREAQLSIDPICPLCGKEIARNKAALDHCHRTGKVRRVVHTWCNSILGRIENWSKRGPWDNIEFLKNVVAYLEKEHTDIIHPTHGKVRRRKKSATVKGKTNPAAKRKQAVRSGNKRRVVRKRPKA